MSDQSGDGPDSEQWQGMTPQDRGFTTPIADDVFEALADWRRRAVCRHLSTADQCAVDVRTLAVAVSSRGQSSSVPDAEATVDAVETELLETHLPKLHDLGVLDFDERSETVRYWGSPTVEKWAEHADAVTDHNEF
ncbi:ArsR family transcriptional regulator [Halomicroarcula sp. GCM10025709]|uniref:DUF7344 domain-containing protein n=1 Tax=Haloarcula TaxID=2237 RepID=UPI0024C23448|nr:ArsR family transcriptional regulator [Halomicroarcula sp. YJ-61-S]